MAYFDSDISKQQIFGPIVNTLKTLFGRSDRQMATLKGEEPDQQKYNNPDSIENRLAKIFIGYGDIQYDRVSKYRDYDRMDIQSTECQVGLDMYAEEAAQPDSKTGKRVWIESEDKEMSNELNNMLTRIRFESKAWGIYRNIAKYGDCFEYLLLGTQGIHDIQFIHPARVERVQEDGLLGFKSPELSNIVPTDNKIHLFKPWDFCHFRLIAFDQESVYGRSMLESLRKIWKQYTMLETMIVLYRIAKAVQRNIFYVDVGQASVQETAQLVKDYERFLKNKTQYVDPVTKDFKLDFNPATMLQDIVWPVRTGSQSKVEPLQNNSNIGPLTDLELFRTKMRTGLGIPKDYFDGEVSGAWNSKEALILQDARFSRKIQRLQDAMREGLTKACQIHWALTHQEFLMPNQIEVKLGTISDSAERIREDILLRKAQIMEVLAGISVTMGWNRKIWTEYLLDQVFPLPAVLRAKLNTPDPRDIEQLEREIELNTAAGSAITQHKTQKAPKKVTADNIQKGLRTFGAAREGVEGDELTPELTEEFKEAGEKLTEAVEELDELNSLYEAKQTEVPGILKEDFDKMLQERLEKINDVLTGKSIGYDKDKINWRKLPELGMAPGAIDESKGYDKEPDVPFKSSLN